MLISDDGVSLNCKCVIVRENGSEKRLTQKEIIMKRVLFFLFFLLLHECVSARLPDLIPYRKGNLWGYCDSTKRMIIEPKYSSVYLFSENTAIVSKGEAKYIIDKKGNETRLDDSIFLISPISNNGFRIFDGLNSGSGVMNEKGELVMRPVNYSLTWMKGNYLYAEDDKLRPAAVFNLQGKKLLDLKAYPKFETWDDDFTGRYVCRDKKKKFGIIDTNGVVLIPFRYREEWYSGYDGYVFLTRDSVFCYDKNCKPYKFLKRDSKEYFGFELPPSDSSRPVYYEDFDFIYKRFRASGKYGFKDKAGNIVVQPKYKYVDKYWLDELMPVHTTRKYNSKWRFVGYIDVHGTEYWEN